MRTYKFLAKGAVGPISGFAWPSPRGGAPGAWIEVAGPLALCVRGVHVCQTSDLAHWMHDELWETEADGDRPADRIDGLDCIVVRRARLVRRIDAWSEGGAARLAAACIARATQLVGSAADENARGFLDDATLAVSGGYPTIAAYCAAMAVARLEPAERERTFRRERGWQAAWITRELIAA